MWKKKRSFGNIMFGLNYAAEEASSSAKRNPPKGNGHSAFALCASTLKLCGGCQKADRWGWGKWEGAEEAASSLYHIKH